MATTEQRQDEQAYKEARLEERQVYRHGTNRLPRLPSGHTTRHLQRVLCYAPEEGWQ